MYNTLKIRQNIEDVLRKIGKDLIKIGKHLQKFNCTNQGVSANEEHAEIDSIVINKRVNIDHEGYITMKSNTLKSDSTPASYINLDKLPPTNLLGIPQPNYINLDEFGNIKHNSDIQNIIDPYV